MDQPPYQSLNFTEDDLDRIYLELSPGIKDEVNRRTAEALARQGYDNVRQGSPRWIKLQRAALLSLLCEAEDREDEAELGE